MVKVTHSGGFAAASSDHVAEIGEVGELVKDVNIAAVEHAWNFTSFYVGQRMQIMGFFLYAELGLGAGYLESYIHGLYGLAVGASVAMIATSLAFRRWDQTVRLTSRRGEDALIGGESYLAARTHNSNLRIIDGRRESRGRFRVRLITRLSIYISISAIVGSALALEKGSKIHGHSLSDTESCVAIAFPPSSDCRKALDDLTDLDAPFDPTALEQQHNKPFKQSTEPKAPKRH